jgi:hypothetical protein
MKYAKTKQVKLINIQTAVILLRSNFRKNKRKLKTGNWEKNYFKHLKSDF